MNHRVLILVPAALLSACATLATPPQKTLEVVSDVPAECTFEDKLGQRQFNAPGPVAAQPKHGPGTLSCSKEGFRTATLVVEPQANAATIGNVLMGGLVGIAIDAASGASVRYPKQVHVFLEPERFDSEQAREAWFAAKEQRLAELRKESEPRGDK